MMTTHPYANEMVAHYCETCGLEFDVYGFLIVEVTEDAGLELYFSPADGETPHCPNEPDGEPGTHDVSVGG